LLLLFFGASILIVSVCAFRFHPVSEARSYLSSNKKKNDGPGPILDPTEFSRRCREAIQGNPGSLGRVGKLISKILVAWAASYGVDESGRELVASSRILQEPLVALPDLGDVKQRRIRCNAMTKELLTLVDRYGVLRTASWDGVRALLLLVPLTEGEVFPSAPLRRLLLICLYA
jgi:hypothetical protein